MKANRKFRDGEEAVSAVIGVILMVAITVAIAATVYVYVSGMIGTGGDTTPTLQFTKVDQATTETLTVISADPENIEWADLTIIITADGAATEKDPETDLGFAVGSSVKAGQVIDIYLAEGGTTSADFTVAIRYEPTNTLTNEYTFNRA